MPIRVLFFGQLFDITGQHESMVEGIEDTETLIQFLNAQYPDLKNCKCIIAVDKKIIMENTLLNENSMVALMPPFSGG